MKIIFNKINSYTLLITIVVLLKPLCGHAYYERFLSVVGSIVAESNTIFFAKTDGHKKIDKGFITSSGESLSVVILKVEVVKVLRGSIKPGEKHLVCTWFYPGDPEFDFHYSGNGHEITVLGTQTPFTIQLPQLHYYFIGGFSYETEIKKALKLPTKFIKDKSRVFKTFSKTDDKVIRNACSEPITWP
jgi:hypothetical protein